MTKLACLAGFIAIIAAGCTENTPSTFDDTAKNMEGIYQVSSLSRNAAACSPGGASLLGTDRFAVAFTQTIFGNRVLTVTSCASAADCREKLADMRAQEPVSLQFQYAANEIDGEALSGLGADSGFEEDGVCTQGALMSTKLERVGSQLRVEQSITIANDYLPDNGFCTTTLAQKFAESNACSQMETLTAELLETL